MLYVFKSKYPNLLLNIERNSRQISLISHTSKWPLKQLSYSSSSFYLAPSIFNDIFRQLNLSNSFAVATNEIQNLSNFILSENGVDYEDEHVEELNKIVSFLLSKGCSSKDIKKKCLPYLKSSDCSYQKFKHLDYNDFDIILLLPLLSLPLNILRLAAKQARNDKLAMENFPNRIAYLAHHLELNPSDLIPALAKHSALLTMKFKRLDFKMKVLKSANISTKYIVKDLWIFNYNERLLASRIQTALKAEMEIKPWMLRCSKRFFESMLMKICETQRILDGENVVNYLAKKLHCGTDYVEYMMERNKLLTSINIPKLEQILNFLFEKGYSPQEVRLFPRVFCSSVQTLSQRFEVYQRVKSTLPTISQLCISTKNFEIKLKQKN